MKIIFIKIFLAISSIIITSLFCQWISEKFFFDKFYYYKSVAHGYWIPGKQIKLTDFGKRAQNIAFITSQDRNNKILGTQTEKVFTIAIIGDSLVWGQGLRENDRFANILEDKLNMITPTKVLSLAYPGDNMLENYIKYKLISSLKKDINLYIFGIVDNDLLISNDHGRYDKELFEQILKYCPGDYVYVLNYNNIDSELDKTYADQKILSFQDQYSNICLLRHLVTIFPKDKAIYYSFGDKSDIVNKYKKILKENNLILLEPTDEYLSKFFINSKNYSVSSLEKHPSKVANQMFAEQLYDYIVENGYLPK